MARRHHGTSPGVWLVLPKRESGILGVSMEEAVEEALCFGRIDSRMHPIDADRYRVVFTPRKPASI